MIQRQDMLSITINKEMRGGDGSVVIEHFLDKEKLYGKGRLYARITLQPGCSIGYHTHEDEMETFYVIKGTAEYDDNGTKALLFPGDIAYTPDGHGHSVANKGTEDVELIALIVYR